MPGIILIIILAYTVYRAVFYYTHRKPLTYEQAALLSRRYAREYIKKRYVFAKCRVNVDQHFKSNLDANGRWYEIKIPLNIFPAYVASLLCGKHHEWVVVAIEKNGLVSNMWVNKGKDSRNVEFSCDLNEIIQKCMQVGGYSILRLHNHPNPDPLHYTTLLASELDMISARSCSDIVCKEGINWFDFVCAEGDFIQFYSKVSNTFEVEGKSTSDIIDRIGITPAMDYKLQSDLHGGWRMEPVIGILLMVLVFGSVHRVGSEGSSVKADVRIPEANAVTESQPEDEEHTENEKEHYSEEPEVLNDEESEAEEEETESDRTIKIDGIAYLYDEELEGYIVTGADPKEEIEIPDSIEGEPVVAIGENAFYKHDELKHIILPETIKQIRKEAFCWCKSLESFTFPSSVICVNDSTFWACSSLSSVTLNDSIVSIGDQAFYDCSFTQIKLPSTLRRIGDNAFDCCHNLKSVEIPDGVTSIGKKAFVVCDSMESVSLPNSLTSIGGGCFKRCESLKKIDIPPYVHMLNWEMFADCWNLKTIRMPSTCERSFGESVGDPFVCCNAKVIVY